VLFFLSAFVLLSGVFIGGFVRLPILEKKRKHVFSAALSGDGVEAEKIPKSSPPPRLRFTRSVCFGCCGFNRFVSSSEQQTLPAPVL